MKRTYFAILAALVFAIGCGNKGSDDTKKTEPKGPVVIKDEDLITAIDYEDAAEKSIDINNYKAELVALEAMVARP